MLTRPSHIAGPGWFPVGFAKRPLITGWPDEASRSPRTLQRWSRRWPGCWWGATLEGLLVLDFDADKGGEVGCSGQPASLRAFIEEFGPGALPMTASWRRTPSGGVHVVMRAPADLPSWNGVGWRDRVDVKTGRGCYIVVEGDGYAFIGGRDTLEPEELPEPPVRVLDAIGARKAACPKRPTSPPEWPAVSEATRNYTPWDDTRHYLWEDCVRLARAPEGEQERELNRLGYKWGARVCQRYISADRVLRALTGAALRMTNYRPHEPWERGEVDRKLREAILDGYSNR